MSEFCSRGPVWSNGTVPEGTVVGRATGGNVAALSAAQVNAMGVGQISPVQSAIATGESNFARALNMGAAGALTSGYLYLAYFTAQKTEPVAAIRVQTASTAAGATPTLCKMGFFSVAAPYDTGADLTLLGVTENDTSLFAAANTSYTKALVAPTTKTAGQRYAVGVLVVSSAAMPNLSGITGTTPGLTEACQTPILYSYLGGQSDIAGDITSTVTASTSQTGLRLFYAAVLPA